MHLVGYLYYWQMGFNSVFKGLKRTGGSNTPARAMSLNSEVEIRKSVFNWATGCGSRNPCLIVLYGVQTRSDAHTFPYSVVKDSFFSGFNKAGV